MQDLFTDRCEVQTYVADESPRDLWHAIATFIPDVVVLELDEAHGPADSAGAATSDLAWQLSTNQPFPKVILCSDSEPQMRIFPSHRPGESFMAPLNQETLIRAVLEDGSDKETT